MSLLPDDLSEIVDGLRAFDTRDPFEAWLAAIQSPAKPAVSFCDLDAYEDFVVRECTEGCNTEAVFDGVLRVDGAIAGGIRSQNGKLVMTDRGCIEADVEVATALIDGYVKGNITATERVVLGDHACVVGKVTAPEFAMSVSAILEGELVAISTEQDADRISPQFVTGKRNKFAPALRLKRWLFRMDSDRQNARKRSAVTI